MKLCFAGLLALTAATAAAAPPEDVQGTIRTSLTAWTADFNARNGAKLCDLFARDLRYDYRGFPERDYAAICSLLQKSVSDPDRQFHYDVEIKEIAVSGDLAMVRLVWTLTASGADGRQPSRTQEPGMDIFRRQPNGSWKIWRYIAYEAP